MIDVDGPGDGLRKAVEHAGLGAVVDHLVAEAGLRLLGDARGVPVPLEGGRVPVALGNADVARPVVQPGVIGNRVVVIAGKRVGKGDGECPRRLIVGQRVVDILGEGRRTLCDQKRTLHECLTLGVAVFHGHTRHGLLIGFNLQGPGDRPGDVVHRADGFLHDLLKRVWLRRFGRHANSGGRVDELAGVVHIRDLGPEGNAVRLGGVVKADGKTGACGVECITGRNFGRRANAGIGNRQLVHRDGRGIHLKVGAEGIGDGGRDPFLIGVDVHCPGDILVAVRIPVDACRLFQEGDAAQGLHGGFFCIDDGAAVQEGSTVLEGRLRLIRDGGDIGDLECL